MYGLQFSGSGINQTLRICVLGQRDDFAQGRVVGESVCGAKGGRVVDRVEGEGDFGLLSAHDPERGVGVFHP